MSEAATKSKTMGKSLYERLGGATGIARIVDDVIAAHLANPVVQTRFQNIEDLDHARQMAREFFASGSGGPETYTGRPMRLAHQGMNISEQEYLAVIEDIMTTLDRHGIDESSQKDVLAILYSLRREIIRL